MLLSFLKNWTLPVAIATGSVLYMLFAFVPALSAAADILGPLCETLLPISIFCTLFVTFSKVDFHLMRLRGWHGVVLFMQHRYGQFLHLPSSCSRPLSAGCYLDFRSHLGLYYSTLCFGFTCRDGKTGRRSHSNDNLRFAVVTGCIALYSNHFSSSGTVCRQHFSWCFSAHPPAAVVRLTLAFVVRSSGTSLGKAAIQLVPTYP